MTIGERIKELRKKAGLTQTGLAEKLEVTKGTVSTWERNSRRPGFDTLDAMCGLFQVRLDYLIGQSDDAAPPVPPTNDELAQWAEEEELEIKEQNADALNAALLRLCEGYTRLDSFGKKSLLAHFESELYRCEQQGTLAEEGSFVCAVNVREVRK